MKQLLTLIGATLSVGMLLSSCSGDEDANVGETLLGTSELDINFATESLTIQSEADTNSDLSQISVALIGTLNDKVFGKTQGSAAFQVRLPGAVSFNQATADSVKLFLAYKNHYGVDTTLKQKARVYLLNNPIEYSKHYDANTNISSLIGDEVGSKSFYKNLVSDTIFLKSKKDPAKDSIIGNAKQVDTILRHLVIDLDKTKVGQYILNASSTDLESTVNFLDYFRGLYVKTDDVTDAGKQGVIYGFNMYRSSLMLYYKDKKTLKNGADTLISKRLFFPVTDNSARFNKPTFTRSNDFFNNNEYIYLQGIKGSKAIINSSGLKKWAGATKKNINKATLEVKIATDTTEIKSYPLPYRLNLAAVDENGKKTNLRYTVNGQYLSGILSLNSYSYTFYITEYLQDIVDGKRTFDHFELSAGNIELMGKRVQPTDGKNTASRVVLYNSGEHKPVIKIAYTNY